jgi:hypothetical protein
MDTRKRNEEYLKAILNKDVKELTSYEKVLVTQYRVFQGQVKAASERVKALRQELYETEETTKQLIGKSAGVLESLLALTFDEAKEERDENM